MPSGGGPARLIGRDASIQWAMDDPWQPDPCGPPRFVFIRGRSIVTVAADGSDPREILPEGAAASSRGDDPAADSVADRVVVLADGPDRAVYRMGPSPDAAFTVENQSDDPWVVGLWDDVGAGAVDCGTAKPSSSIGGQVASIGPVVPPSRPALDMVPVTCEVAPHSSARIKDVGFVPRGALEVNVYHVAAPLASGRCRGRSGSSSRRRRPRARASPQVRYPVAMRIATWNVNSLKARMDALEHWLARADPDVLLMQETKLADEDAPAMWFQMPPATSSSTTARAAGTASRSRAGRD